MTTFSYRDFDRQIWEQELEDFVPATVYDMHTHLWSEDHRGSLTGEPTGLRTEIDYRDHLNWAAQLYPGRAFHLLALGTPMPGMDAAGHNAWLAAQLAADPESAVMQMLAQSARARWPRHVGEVVQILYYCAWAKRASTGLHSLAQSCLTYISSEFSGGAVKRPCRLFGQSSRAE